MTETWLEWAVLILGVLLIGAIVLLVRNRAAVAQLRHENTAAQTRLTLSEDSSRVLADRELFFRRREAELLSRVAERDLLVAELRGKIETDWRGTLKVWAMKHRGKGGTVPIYQEDKPICGRFATHRFRLEHPSGDMWDVGVDLRLGPDEEDVEAVVKTI